MAIYHCSIKIVSRGKGKSAVAAAAYRAGEKITNEYDGVTHDYTNKGGVVYSNILLPENAPSDYKDRTVLWNTVEKVEKNINSQLAREVELGLPAECSELQNRALVNAYVKKYFVDKGMCADICIHDKKDGNPHAHVLLTMRPFESDSTWGAKSKKEYMLDSDGERMRLKSGEFKTRKIYMTDWDNRDNAEIWREAWADAVNSLLERQKSDVRIDHRSYARQGIDQIPTVHLGVAAHQMEQRGIRTERGNINRDIEITNQQLRQIKARIRKLQDWLKEEETNVAPPTLYDIISEILNKDGRHTLTNLKEGAKLFSFLQQNKIMDLQDLEKKLSNMIGGQLVISNKLKPIERRLKTLDEHFKHSENFKQYRSYKLQYEKLYAEYKTLKKTIGFFAKQKTQKALDTFNEYAETHRREIKLYGDAEQYLKDALQGHFDPKKLPIKMWKAEQAELLSQKSTLNGEYKTLKEETREVEIMRKNVEDIMRSNRPRQRTREQGMEK